MPKKEGLRNKLSLSFWAIKILYLSAPKHTIIFLISKILREFRELAGLVITTNIFNDIVVSVGRGQVNYTSIYKNLALYLSLELFAIIIAFFRRYSENALNLLGSPKVRQLVYTKIYNLGIPAVEDPEIANKIMRSNESINYILNISISLISMGSKLIQTVIVLASVAIINPLFTLLIIIIRIIGFSQDKYFRRQVWNYQKESTESRRVASTNLGYLTSPPHLHEINLNNAFGFFDKKFMGIEIPFALNMLFIRRKGYAKMYLVDVLSALASTGIYFSTILSLISGKLSVNIGLLQIRLLEKLDSNIDETTSMFNDLIESVTRLEDIHTLLVAKPVFKDGRFILKNLKTGPELQFSNVSFKYPKSNKYIYKNLNLHIKAGEKIAIVGHNGAGKTTLVKLISRIYQVNSGQIFLNSKNINTYKAKSIYKNLGVLFQEYNNYTNLTPFENIFAGRPGEKANKDRIIQSAKHADAHNFITALPQGYQQILSERFKGGTRLSTGQWQKLAIARFFYRNAPLVIFDEPTAAIDAQSEAKIFSRIYKHFQNKTVIIISHRFSTVREADRIIVVDNGKIIEEGSHAQLIKLNGKYAHSFNLQAKGYAA